MVIHKKKVCKKCGKYFYPSGCNQKYCCARCRKTDMDKPIGIRKYTWRNGNDKKETGQMCWYCKNATGNCSWSRNLTPVDGWDAEKTYNVDGSSYRIKFCPEFIHD